jgi:hypothetical protein
VRLWGWATQHPSNFQPIDHLHSCFNSCAPISKPRTNLLTITYAHPSTLLMHANSTLSPRQLCVGGPGEAVPGQGTKIDVLSSQSLLFSTDGSAALDHRSYSPPNFYKACYRQEVSVCVTFNVSVVDRGGCACGIAKGSGSHHPCVVLYCTIYFYLSANQHGPRVLRALQ